METNKATGAENWAFPAVYYNADLRDLLGWGVAGRRKEKEEIYASQ